MMGRIKTWEVKLKTININGFILPEGVGSLHETKILNKTKLCKILSEYF